MSATYLPTLAGLWWPDVFRGYVVHTTSPRKHAPTFPGEKRKTEVVPSGGASGIYMAALIERLGIAAELKPKTKLAAPGGALYEMVAKGEAETGFTQMSEILAEPSVELIGPLPTAIQNYTQFAAGIVTTSKQVDVGKTLIAYLSSPTATTVLTAKGFEPC
jgi:molybdate transport system substrate-binding protein